MGIVVSLYKEFAFEAAHSLPHLPSTHKCSRQHGHSYRVRVYCKGEVDPDMGWVIDYGDISAMAGGVIEAMDHRNLNDLFTFKTTAENLALYLLRTLSPFLPLLWKVEVSETAKTWVCAERE